MNRDELKGIINLSINLRLKYVGVLETMILYLLLDRYDPLHFINRKCNGCVINNDEFNYLANRLGWKYPSPKTMHPRVYRAVDWAVTYINQHIAGNMAYRAYSSRATDRITVRGMVELVGPDEISGINKFGMPDYRRIFYRIYLKAYATDYAIVDLRLYDPSKDHKVDWNHMWYAYRENKCTVFPVVFPSIGAFSKQIGREYETLRDVCDEYVSYVCGLYGVHTSDMVNYVVDDLPF